MLASKEPGYGLFHPNPISQVMVDVLLSPVVPSTMVLDPGQKVINLHSPRSPIRITTQIPVAFLFSERK